MRGPRLESRSRRRALVLPLMVSGEDGAGRVFNESTRTWMLDRWRAFGLTPLGSYADPGFTAGTKTLTLRRLQLWPSVESAIPPPLRFLERQL